MSENHTHEWRLCWKCGRELPLTEEHWYSGIIRSLIDSPEWSPFPRWCKQCCIDSAKTYYYNNHDKRIKYDREYRSEHLKEIRARDRAYIRLPDVKRRKKMYDKARYYRKTGNVAKAAEYEAQLAALKREQAKE